MSKLKTLGGASHSVMETFALAQRQAPLLVMAFLILFISLDRMLAVTEEQKTGSTQLR